MLPLRLIISCKSIWLQYFLTIGYYSYSITVKQLRLGFITRDISVILIPSVIHNAIAAIAVVIVLLSTTILITLPILLKSFILSW